MQEQQRRTDLALSIGIDIIEFTEPVYKIIDVLIEETYGKEGSGWFFWFCYDSDYGRRDWSNFPSFITDENGKIHPAPKTSNSKYGAFDAEGNPICFSIESTWNFLEENYRNLKPYVAPDGEIVQALNRINFHNHF